MNLLCSIEGCSYLAERNGICSRHNREARKAAAPKAKPARKRIAKVSDNQQERLEMYYPIRDLFLKVNPLCQSHGKCFPDEDIPLSKDIHHMKSRDSELLYDVRYFLACCRRCHERITIESEWAYNQGLSLSRHQTETI